MKSLSPRKPHLLIMVGIPGSGRSTFADQFANTFNAPFIDTDLLKSYTQSDAAAEQLTQRVLHQLFRTKASIIYDGPSATRAQRTELARHAHAAGYTPLFIWVQVDTPSAQARATHRSAQPAPITAEEFERAIRRFTAPNASENAVVISGKHTYASQVKVVLKRLADSNEHDTPPQLTVAPRSRSPIIIR
jgi:predicted kinase